jgi:parallel beta-helix repeat protein/predicted outer membrane repeat protein
MREKVDIQQAKFKRSRRILTLKFISLVIALTVVLTFACNLHAATLEVGTGKPYTTIQSAINDSVNGDTVLVYDGAYVENINFNGKAITVKSVNGATSTIIDGNASGYVVTFSGEGPGSVLDGFTIRNGGNSANHTNGGGIYCGSSSPTITNCTISGNRTGYSGGGIYCYYSSPAITNCTITGNTATWGAGIECYVSSSPIITNCTITGNTADDGGGIHCYYSSPAITSCTITGNTASRGGGIYCEYYSSPAITNCTITENTATWLGGGIICLSAASPAITNCIITGNTASTNGGGIRCEAGCAPVITNCIITGNTAAGSAGGIGCYSIPSPSITNCTITGNTADSGAGIHCSNSSPAITNCIITGNTASTDGGGINCDGYCSPVITNCTITGNTADSGAGIYCYISSPPTITNCTISDNIASTNGGGIYCQHFSPPVITNCTISENMADSGGGIYCSVFSSQTITNCTIAGNTANSYGGGIWCSDSSSTIKNTILWGDTAPAGKEIYRDLYSTITITYSDVEGGWIGTGNVNSDPLFVGNSDYHLKAGSPCIDTGTSTGAPTNDIDGDVRPKGAGYDIGSDESFRITSITQNWSENNNITITWESTPGESYDILLKDEFTGTFNPVDSVSASGSTTSWTDDGTWLGGTHPTTVQQRYYKVSVNGTDSGNTVGMYKITASQGMNLISLPLIPFSTALKDVIGTQVTGANNEGAADRLWVWNGSTYQFAWLVEGTGTPFDGKWFTGNLETTITLDADQGAWLQIRIGHGNQTVYLLGEVSSTDRTIPLIVGMNLVGSCYPVSVPLGDKLPIDSDLWESGATGATNEGGADRVWSWTGSNYQFHWLVEGAGPTYDGLWFTGNQESTLQLESGKGYWVQIREVHDPFIWVYPKPY